MRQIARVDGWPRLKKYDVIGNWQHSIMQLTGQKRFMRSLSGGYKMTNGSRVRKLFWTEEAIKEA